jgi:hypothetical protein
LLRWLKIGKEAKEIFILEDFMVMRSVRIRKGQDRPGRYG